MVIATPGKSASYHIWRITVLPSATMIPQAAAPGSSPNPKKLRAASSRITCPTRILVTTINVLTVLGKICLHMITGVLTPVILAKVTKS
jgi:hypothetical protein